MFLGSAQWQVTASTCQKSCSTRFAKNMPRANLLSAGCAATEKCQRCVVLSGLLVAPPPLVSPWGREDLLRASKGQCAALPARCGKNFVTKSSSPLQEMQWKKAQQCCSFWRESKKQHPHDSLVYCILLSYSSLTLLTSKTQVQFAIKSWKRYATCLNSPTVFIQGLLAQTESLTVEVHILSTTRLPLMRLAALCQWPEALKLNWTRWICAVVADSLKPI